MKSYTLLILFIFVLSQFASGHYETAYIEDLCSNTTVGVWNLGSESSNSSGLLKSSRHHSFMAGMNCTILLQPPLGFGIVLSVRHLDFRPHHFPNCPSYVQIGDGGSIADPYPCEVGTPSKMDSKIFC
ncbi:uncharacterized protein TNCV_1655781 [Trichonephila clavipes]|nr:uncharacterized protein TNCV_1655781 [Trichonephila clavipes]